MIKNKPLEEAWIPQKFATKMEYFKGDVSKYHSAYPRATEEESQTWREMFEKAFSGSHAEIIISCYSINYILLL